MFLDTHRPPHVVLATLALLLAVPACGGSGGSDGGGGGGPSGPFLAAGPVFDLGARNLVSLAVGDLDETGSLDLAVADATNGQVVVIFNPLPTLNGPPSITVFLAAVPGLTQVAIADVTDDGHRDVVCTNPSGALGVIPFYGVMGFDPVTTSTGFAVNLHRLAVADVNGDLLPDLVGAAAGVSSVDLGVYLGNGNGTFQAPTPIRSFTYFARDLYVGDFGLLSASDVVMVEGKDSRGLILTPTDARTAWSVPDLGSTRTPIGGSDDPVVTALGDMDGDGRPDFVSTESSFSATLLTVRPGGAGGFGAPDITVLPTSVPFSLAVGDIDGVPGRDVLLGSLDLSLSSSLTLHRASGSGFVPDQSFALATRVPVALASADLDLDGHDDVVSIEIDFGASAASVRVYRNVR